MKHIHLNLKRFDILEEFGGVNRNQKVYNWSSKILSEIEDKLSEIQQIHSVKFTVYFPEAHLIDAIQNRKNKEVIQIGCQGVYENDSKVDGNFGAFTTHRTANSMKQLGVQSTIIGHLEERNSIKDILKNALINDFSSIEKLLNNRVKAAQNGGLDVLFCIGEILEERDNWREVLKGQIEIGLDGIDLSNLIIAYEPAWAIGVGKTPPSSTEIAEVIGYIKTLVPEVPVIYGGGLKHENSKDLASIKELDGGLIALTSFTGEIGFYPNEYIEIVNIFLENI